MVWIIRLGGMRFSSTEINDLVTAWLVISLAFTIAFRGYLGLTFLILLAVSGITVGVGFLLHEIMHKYYAQKFGCWAEFRANRKMLLFALLLSFLGFIFAAPGGVFIKGVVDRRKQGIISVAGPMTNVILALIFIAAASFLPFADVWTFGAQINAFLAVFNLLPFGPLDGTKVLRWGKKYYAASVALALIVFLVALV